MGVFEIRIVFQPISEASVPPNMTQPNNTNCHAQFTVGSPSQENHQCWREITMPQVIEESPNLCVS